MEPSTSKSDELQTNSRSPSSSNHTEDSDGKIISNKWATRPAIGSFKLVATESFNDNIDSPPQDEMDTGINFGDMLPEDGASAQPLVRHTRTPQLAWKAVNLGASQSAKEELASRLRRRIDANSPPELGQFIPSASPQGNSPSLSPSALGDEPHHDSKPHRPTTRSANGVPIRPRNYYLEDTVQPTKGRKGKNEEGSDSEIEGFHIYSAENPEESVESAKKRSEKKAEKLVNPNLFPNPKNSLEALQHTLSPVTAKKFSDTAFGPLVIRMALKGLGGRGTGNDIADWICEHRPEYLRMLGDRKKLRYSIIGILSAKAYGTVFRKETVTVDGAKKSLWILDEDAKLAGQEEFEASMRERDSASVSVAEQEPTMQPNTLQLTPHPLSYHPQATNPLTGEPPMVEVHNPYDKKVCVLCKEGVNDDKLLLCDNCDAGCHMYCLKPPLTEVPSGAWYCDTCLAIAADPREDPIPDGYDDMFDEPNNRACEKHRRWKKRCPPDCPMRPKPPKAGQGQPLLQPAIPVVKKKEGKKKKSKILMNSDDETGEEGSSAEDNFTPIGMSSSLPTPPGMGMYHAPSIEEQRGPTTYIAMIEEAIEALGGAATTPDITNFMEERHGEILATKTKTWRNSVSGCLSVHFARVPYKDHLGRTVWTLPKYLSRYHGGDVEAERVAQQLAPKKLRNMNPAPMRGIPIGVQSKRPQLPPNLRVPGRSSTALRRIFDPKHLDDLSRQNPYVPPSFGVQFINRQYPLQILTKLEHPGPVYRTVWGADSIILATVCITGVVKIWDSEQDWRLLQEIRDKDETNIEEWYDAAFCEGDSITICIGKLKDKDRWNDDINDFETIAGSIKFFRTVTGEKILQLTGHTEDVLGMKLVTFNNNRYLVTCGQDGKIIKWSFSSDMTILQDHKVLANSPSSIAISIDFVPNTGNKFFIASYDGGLKLFDFESDQLVQNFPDMYTYLCDCVRFVNCVEFETKPNEFYLLTKGVELISEMNEPVRSNSCHLRKLILPENGVGKFILEDINIYQHKKYESNVWLTHLSSNGRYVLSPAVDGRVFVWNLRSADIVAILSDHDRLEIRDISFHSTRKLMVTCGDDCTARIYVQPEQAAEDDTKNGKRKSDTEEDPNAKKLKS